jgi:hypothetical protein
MAHIGRYFLRPSVAGSVLGVVILFTAAGAIQKATSSSEEASGATSAPPVVAPLALESTPQPEKQTPSPAPPAAQFSPGVTAALRLLDAGVNKDIVKSYIQNSSLGFELSAEDIIALNERGVAPDLIVAMVTRSGEQRPAALPQTIMPPMGPMPMPEWTGPGPEYYPYPPEMPATYAPEPAYGGSPYSYWYYSYPYYPGYSAWWYPYSSYLYYHGSHGYHNHGYYHSPYYGYHGAYAQPYSHFNYQSPISVGPDWGASRLRLSVGPHWGGNLTAAGPRPASFTGRFPARTGGGGMQAHAGGRR